MNNVFKSWFTSVLGAVVMCFAGYDWFFVDDSVMSPTETAITGVVGFALLFMTDSISAWINQVVTALIDKFKGKQ